jgi:hypothetical protein
MPSALIRLGGGTDIFTGARATPMPSRPSRAGCIPVPSGCLPAPELPGQLAVSGT